MGQNNCARDNQNANIIINNGGHSNAYCIKCGRKLDNSSTSFCDKECRRDYYSEIRKENDALFGEWIGRD